MAAFPLRLAVRAVVVAALLTPAPALAQAPGPFGGLFGRTPERSGRTFTALDFRSALAVQFDDTLLDSEGRAEGEPTGGIAGGGNVGLSLDLGTDRLRLGASTTTTYQEYMRPREFGATAYESTARFVGTLTTRLTADGAASWRRSPFFQLTPFVPGASVPDAMVPGDPFSLRRTANDVFEGRLGFASAYSARSTLSGSVSRRQTRFRDEPENNFQVWGVRGQWTRQLNRRFQARLGYGREHVDQPSLGSGQFIHEVLDVGINFTQPFSLARRTSLTFQTQTSMIKESGGDRRYRLNGAAALVRTFRRTWGLSLSAQRTTEFLPGFLQPLFQDSVSASLGGLLSPRLQWSSSATAGKGEVGFDGSQKYLSYFGHIRLNTAITRNTALFVQYAYYRYEIPIGSISIPLLPLQSRHTVAAGLTVWIPIINRMRAPRDPR